MATTTAVQKKEQAAPPTLADVLRAQLPKLSRIAPKYMNVERMIRLLLAAAGRDEKILKCTQESVLAFCMKCSETGLETIGAGGAWPIPYGTTLTFVPDYRGLVNCARRAGCIKNAFPEIVYAADEFEYELGLEPKLTHKPARHDRGEVEAVYCVVRLPDNTKHFVVMTADEVNAIRKRSKASGSGPWVTDYAEMAKKTVVRRAMKPFAGASKELDAAIEADDAATGLVTAEPIQMPRAIAEPKKPEAAKEPTANATACANVVCNKPLPDGVEYDSESGPCCSAECAQFVNQQAREDQ